jgi:hypothetical protein
MRWLRDTTGEFPGGERVGRLMFDDSAVKMTAVRRSEA